MRIERIPQPEAHPNPPDNGNGPDKSGEPNPAGTPAGDDSAQHSQQVSNDLFEWSPRDLTSDGRLPIIVSSNHPVNLAPAEKDLKTSRNGSTLDRELDIINGFSARVSPGDLDQVFHDLPDGVGVRINSWIAYPDPQQVSDIAKDAQGPGPIGKPAPRPAPPTPASDTSRATMGIQAVWDRGYTGRGVGVAVIDSGIYPHPDVKNHITGWVDIASGKTAPFDSFGHGTHVAGDIAGTGVDSGGKIKGTAPDANLIGVRITTVAEAIKGLQWCIENRDKYNIKVINLSLGDFAKQSYKNDPWTLAAQKAIDAGMTVIVAAGNEGPDPGTISTPGTSPRVITVGALDDKHTVDRKDDTVAAFSSRGPTSVDGITKPDLIAPGVGVYGPLDPGATLDVPELPHIGRDYIAISGTSMATPLVSGLVADMLQANPNLKHDDVKKILMATADRYLKDGKDAQGAGEVDPEKALDLALAAKDNPGILKLLGTPGAGQTAVA